MAPTAPTPGKRLSAREKALKRLADPLLPRKLHRENNVVSDSFIDSKKDKRTIKHNAFVSRIAKTVPGSSGSGSSRKLKRRRPSKKLVTTLESLGDVLGEISNEIREDQESGKTMDAQQEAMGRVRHKSLKTRPGALKRKEKVVKTEMDRFGRSLAQLATVKEPAAAAAAAAAPAMEVEQQQQQPTQTQGAQATTQQPATTNRWAALRGFISATMEQNPAFLKTA
ncbi:hypothetical protein NEUTE1DRAFT_89802 [Neurospora tetrasperma FGSC 2508]|uniref:Ribosome biogenesis protein SLX9 n=1 Tax=Neurospora tetrasperma (strain FGSC 2508 / ATCC MYA-4615 / P0657) TaxID=510951 RepID=F8MYV7_NEUT8|nr:uncharacterized protein NEUTE1DRAFT_89802 [Neurospora tetrasperma FGSC 2508]EGO51955.1 hypothetical protein NEUTE1DRAFT_89802 [Neurospora tetrasperma FGSC 2508]